MTERTWTCQRQTGGKVCRHVNPRRRVICVACGKRRPKTAASPRDVPDVPYETCVEMFGPRCGICDRLPKEGKKLHRDHDHATGEVRGLLCFQCNIRLRRPHTLEWIARALAYLRRHADRMAQEGRPDPLYSAEITEPDGAIRRAEPRR